MPEPEQFYVVVSTHDSEENDLAGTDIGRFELDDDMSATAIGNMVRAIVRIRVNETESE